MQTITEIVEMQRAAEEARNAGLKIGFVPTMGYLHEGHLSLIRRAGELCQLIVVSIFVNPTQFGPQEDYRSYPRDFSRDARLCQETGCDLLFIPTVEQIYPQGYCTYIDVEDLTDLLCGASRPGHFRGVTTVVTKLFNIVKPHVAVFGQKDAQQAIIIRRMARDLNQDLEIEVAPTIREHDGLAMSSRNAYLNREERAQAPVLYRALEWARGQIDSGERRAEPLIQGMAEVVGAAKMAEIDYIAIVDADRLRPVKRLEGEVLIALAIRFGRARLIDNCLIQLEENG